MAANDSRQWTFHKLGTDKSRSWSVPGSDKDMFVDRSRTWNVHGHGQTAVAVADWMRARTDRGRGCGLDKATVSWLDNGAGISSLNRDRFADTRTLKRQGVRRPTCHPHKSCGHSRINLPACHCNPRRLAGVVIERGRR